MVIRKWKKMTSVLATLFIVVMISGCSTTTPPPDSTKIDAPPVDNSMQSHDDILLPSEMQWDSKKSMAIRTASFIGGLYHYSGRVEINSLKDYIKTSMEKNKWKLVGEISYEKIMFAFVKPNKTCMITIFEGFGGTLGTTHVDLAVTVDLAAANGLNAFGEPVN